MEAEERQVEEAVVAAILDELNQFIDPPTVTGIGIPPDERLWLSRRVSVRVLDLLRRSRTEQPQKLSILADY